MIYAPGVTSQSIDVQVVDDTGVPVTGLAAATFPAVTWSRAGANADNSLTLSDLATLTTAWASGGVKERGGGVYRLDLPDAAFASAGEVKVRGEVTNKRLLAPWIDVGKVAATVAAAGDFFQTFPANFAALGLTAGGHVSNVDTLTTYTGNTPQTGDAYAVVTDANFGNAKLVRSTTPANTFDVSATGEGGLDFNNVKDATAAHTLTNIRVPNVTLADTVTTYTGNTPQTGDAFGRVGANGAGLTALGDARLAHLDADVSSRSTFAGGALAGDAMTLTAGERSAVADVTLRRHMANVEASPNGDALSKSSLYGSVQQIQAGSVAGTTLTVHRTDGVTVLGTFTLTSDPAAEPITGVA